MEEDNRRDRKIGRRGKDKKERARYVRISWSIFAKVRDKCSALLRILAGVEKSDLTDGLLISCPSRNVTTYPFKEGPKMGESRMKFSWFRAIITTPIRLCACR